MYKVVGLSGYAGVGKDAIALRMRDYCRVGFADELKVRIAGALGISLPVLESKKKQLRPLLVEFGRTGRMLDAYMWVKVVRRKIIENPHAHLVIPDVRYVNEVEMIREMGGIVIMVHRDNVGPANDEEGRTVPEVARICERRVHNFEGNPDIAAKSVLGYASEA